MASYIDTYDFIAERDLVKPFEPPEYVEGLAARFGSLLDLRGKDFCDVGSGAGYLVKYALSNGARSVTAIDIAAPFLRTVASEYHVPAFLANAENIPFFKHFDVIAATDILEHVLNVTNFLITANWALRDNGIFAVRVPYMEDMMQYSNFNGLPMHFTHLRTFDKRLLVHMIEKAGFKVVKLQFAGFQPNVMNPALERFPRLRDRLQRCLTERYGAEDAGAAPFRSIFMCPIEIGAIAMKREHVQVEDQYPDLKDFNVRP